MESRGVDVGVALADEARAHAQGGSATFVTVDGRIDRVLKEPVHDRPAAAKADPSRATETFQMDLKDVERLQQVVALKRRAHLKWEAASKQDTFYLERLERNAVLVGRSTLCDLRVPAGPKHHLLVLRNRTGYEVRNLSSWFRMRVNGAAVAQAMLKGGDVIDVHGLRLTFFDEIA